MSSHTPLFLLRLDGIEYYLHEMRDENLEILDVGDVLWPSVTVTGSGH